MTKAKPLSEHKKRGRPTCYKSEYAEQATKLCELGATDAELADFFKVNLSTIRLWTVEHPDFSQAVTRGKDAVDERVVRSLAQRALGYEIETEKVFNHNGKIVRAKTREHVPADPGAAMNWLKNRKRAEWQDGFVHEHKLPTISEIEEATRDLDKDL